jgi:hypothetical protein
MNPNDRLKAQTAELTIKQLETSLKYHKRKLAGYSCNGNNDWYKYRLEQIEDYQWLIEERNRK